jgi:hypothetical protein
MTVAAAFSEGRSAFRAYATEKHQHFVFHHLLVFVAKCETAVL